MAQVRKFMFDDDFGEAERQVAPQGTPEQPPLIEEPPPPPTFTEDELVAAREEAYEEGRRDGIHEAEAETARMTATAMQAIAARLQSLDRQQSEQAERTLHQALNLAGAIARKILPHSAERHALTEVQGLFSEVLSFLLEEPRIIVRLHDGLVQGMRGYAEEIAASSGFEGRLAILADNRLAPGDCRIEWADGGAERDQERLWREIEAAMERVLGRGADQAARRGIERAEPEMAD